ncbi:MAG TPA: hypothetical protein VND65_09370 [Candidatus Binatia bacterium]|nr:hypothetical protein [Candidatus Binatia bacterium]
MRVFFRWLTWLCLSLTLWAAVAESTHSHANKTESPSCPLCAVAHSTAPAPVSSHTTPLFAAIGVMHDRELSAITHLTVSKLGIRGPPADRGIS